MSVLNLMAKMGLDISDFRRGIAQAKVAAAPIGSAIGDNIKGQIKSALGAAAATFLVRRSLETAKEIHTGANRMGIDTDTYQTLKILSDKYGISIEELAKEMKSGSIIGADLKNVVMDLNTEYAKTGQIIDDGTVNNLYNANEQIERLFNRLGPLVAFIVDKLIRAFEFVQGASKMQNAALWNMVEGKSQSQDSRALQMITGAKEMVGAFLPADKRSAQFGDKSEAESIINFMQRFKYGNDRIPQISGLGQVGGYMNPGMMITTSGPEYQLQQLNSQVAEIRSNTRRFAE